MTSILLATPTSDHTVTSGFARSVFNLVKLLTARGIAIDWRTIRSSDVALARNRLATRFLSEAYTHLLFIDEDHSFDAADIVACLDFDRPVTGAGIVRKALDLKAFVEFFQQRSLEPTPENIAVAMSCACSFALELDLAPDARTGNETRVQVERGFARVRKMATGVMLIRRDAFERMIEAGCVTRWKNTQVDAQAAQYRDGIYGFFDPVQADDMMLSEDYSFCHRWTQQCAGEIWCKIDSYVSHHGDFAYKGRYIDRLKHNMM